MSTSDHSHPPTLYELTPTITRSLISKTFGLRVVATVSYLLDVVVLIIMIIMLCGTSLLERLRSSQLAYAQVADSVMLFHLKMLDLGLMPKLMITRWL